MSKRAKIPNGASVAAMATGIIPNGPRAGQAINWTVFHGYASKGYRSRYERVPTAWLEVTAGTDFRGVWRYSGARFCAAIADYRENLATFSASGGTPLVAIEPVAA